MTGVCELSAGGEEGEMLWQGKCVSPGLSAHQALFNLTDASTHMFSGPVTTHHIGGEISLMPTGYFMFAGCLIRAFSGFNGCEVQLLLTLLVLDLWRLWETQCQTPEIGLGEN